MPIEPGIELRKDEIFKRVTEEQIFEKYLQLAVDEGVTYMNPLRPDRKAGCRYYRATNGRMYFKDFSKGYHWDCFNVVQFMYNNCSFTDACRIIIRDFKLNNTPVLYDYAPQELLKLRMKIQVSVRSWTQDDIKYWGQFNIGLDDLSRFNIYPCKAIWINGEHYRCKTGDPCYAYYFGEDLFKIYFPYRKENKFYQNIHVDDDILQGYIQLKYQSDILVITKSFKDVICFDNFGIDAVAPMSEANIISKKHYEDLLNHYDYIVCVGDNDARGRAFMLAHNKEYRIPYYVYPKTWAKDTSDNIKRFGFNKIKEVVENRRLELYGKSTTA